jgi:phage/plasmid-like protein (TIGR03299 family)
MSHAIDETNGNAAMAYVGEKPWHGLGQEVKKGATIEEIEKAAHLDWQVNLVPACYRVPTKDDGALNGGMLVESRHRFLLRGDTNKPLTLVGPDYVPFQNRQILDFFRKYVEAGDMHIETAGSLNGGQNIWALAKLGVGFDVGTAAQPDKSDGYVLLMNPHQYGKGMIAKLTEIRVVCQNTMTMALGGRGSSVQLWHTAELSEGRMEEIRERLNLSKEKLVRSAEEAKKLSAAQIDYLTAVDFSYNLFAPTADREKIEDAPKPVDRVLKLFGGEAKGADLPSAKGTAWGLLNAVTEYFDHERGRSANSRLNYAWLGGGQSLKLTAKNRLLELIGS